MKKLYCLITLAFLSIAVFAQKLLPVIKTGTVINLVVIDHNNIAPITVTIKNAGDTLTLAWKATGAIIKGIAPDIDKYFTQPHQEGIASQRFQNDETLVNVSRIMYKRFLNNKKRSLVYQGVTYQDPINNNDNKNFALDGRFVDATYLESKDGKYQLFVLNYAPFPLIMQATNPLLGFSYKVISIK